MPPSYHRATRFALFLIATLAAAAFMPIAEANPPGQDWRVREVQALDELGTEQLAMQHVLSPDGTRIATYSFVSLEYDDPVLCLYTLADESNTCTPIPEAEQANPQRLIWSPDSRYLAYTEDAFRVGAESDLWVFDTQEMTRRNMTDDGVSGVYYETDPQQYSIDFMPRWHPTNGDLYFFRHEDIHGDARQLLYRLPAGEDEPVLVRDLSEELPRLSVFPAYEAAFLDGRAAISADGARLAFGVVSRDIEDPANGVYVLELDGQSPPRQVLGLADLFNGTPAWQDRRPGVLLPEGLAWSGDGRFLVVVGRSGGEAVQGVPAMVQVVDMETGEFAPLVDFSTVSEQEFLVEVEQPEDAPRLYVPWMVSLTPDGQSLLMFSVGPPGLALLAAPIGQAEARPAIILLDDRAGEEELLRLGRIETPSVSADGRVLMMGNLITLERADG